jgi:ketosteroid isomerase-like protein
MSEENVEIVRRGLEACNRRDLTTWLASFDPDAEVDWSRSRGPLMGVYRGHDGIETFWDAWFSTFEQVQIEIQGFTEVGPEVATPATSGGVRASRSSREAVSFSRSGTGRSLE